MALAPVKPLYSASATATNGSDTITVTGSVNCSYIASGAIVCLGTRQLVDAISGTAPDGSGNSTIKLRRPWDDPTTTGKLLVFMSWEGLADAVNRLRGIIDASEASVQGAFSFMGNWSAVSGNFPDAPAEGLGSQVYRISVQGTIGGRIYRVGEVIYYDQYSLQWRSFFELATAFSTGLLAGADASAWRTALQLATVAQSGSYNDLVNKPTLGTAADTDKTTSATDTTAGRLLKVGDGGLLGTTTTVNGNLLDFSTINENFPTRTTAVSGNYFGIPIDSYRPVGFLTKGAINTRWSFLGVTDSGTLRAFMANSSSPSGIELYHKSNILGTVSQSGGTPTGAIIERGSNANGEYVRFADGTQICTRTISYTGPLETAFGSLFISPELATGSYPAAFSTVHGVHNFARRNSANAPIWFASGTAVITGGFPNGWLNAAVANNTSLLYTVYQVAYGRWY